MRSEHGWVFCLNRLWACSDFGAIFGDLLPGNTCKLDAPEGQDITDGLEIKVNLGGVWKQSLTELSGGQRCVGAAAAESCAAVCLRPCSRDRAGRRWRCVGVFPGRWWPCR